MDKLSVLFFGASLGLGSVAVSCGGGDTNGSGGSTSTSTTTTDVGDPLSWSVLQEGPFTCGHRIVEMTYTLPSGLGERTIPVHFWYPSHVAEGDHPVYKALFEDTHSWDDVPLAESPWKGGLFPIEVHSHGYKGFSGNSARLFCHMASHGWVAIAPEHVGNTIGDTPDPLPLSVYYHRPLDMRAALDMAASMPEGDPLAGKLDLDHVGLSGHSFGTYTTWAVAGATFDTDTIQMKCDTGQISPCSPEEIALFSTDLSDKRPKMAIPQAGGHSDLFGDYQEKTVSVPVMLMTGSLDEVGAVALYGNVSGLDFTWVDVEGGCHQLFGLGNGSIGSPDCQNLPDEEGFAIVNPIALAYARYHVLGDKSAEVKGIVEGTQLISEREHFKHKGP